MIDSRTAPYAAFVLRAALGLMFIAHALLKYAVFTLPGTVKFFESLGLPGPLAYVTFVAELVGGALILAGLGTRWVSAALIPVLALASCGGSKPGASPSESTLVAPPDTTIPGTVGSSPEGTQHYAGLARDHTSSPVAYDQNPPVGGPHNPRWQPCGFYSEPIETERGVHSMEHGAVWITYRPDLEANQVEALRSLSVGHTHLLISPFPGLPSAVVASAWGEQLLLDSVAKTGRLVCVSDANLRGSWLNTIAAKVQEEEGGLRLPDDQGSSTAGSPGSTTPG